MKIFHRSKVDRDHLFSLKHIDVAAHYDVLPFFPFCYIRFKSDYHFLDLRDIFVIFGSDRIKIGSRKELCFFFMLVKFNLFVSLGNKRVFK